MSPVAEELAAPVLRENRHIEGSTSRERKGCAGSESFTDKSAQSEPDADLAAGLSTNLGFIQDDNAALLGEEETALHPLLASSTSPQVQRPADRLRHVRVRVACRFVYDDVVCSPELPVRPSGPELIACGQSLVSHMASPCVNRKRVESSAR